MKFSRYLNLTVLLTGVFLLLLAYNFIAGAVAAENVLKGWAWSSNIGWVNFNCEDREVCGQSDYKVSINPSTGELSGYAWSSNIGWIKSDPAGAYPINPQKSAYMYWDEKEKSVKMDGWMRACNVFKSDCSGDLKPSAETGGWDGWIKTSGVVSPSDSGISPLPGSGNSSPDIENYGVYLEGNKLKGYAWGSEVVGWLSFSGNLYGVEALIDAPNCDFTADPSSIVLPQYSTLSWSCQHITGCSIDQGIGAVESSGQQKVRPKETTTYTLTCNGRLFDSDIFASWQATVNVSFKAKLKEILPR